MKITHDEFKAFFNGGLTLARREELLLAILTNPQCGRIASIFFLLDELGYQGNPEVEEFLARVGENHAGPVEVKPTEQVKITPVKQKKGSLIGSITIFFIELAKKVASVIRNRNQYHRSTPKSARPLPPYYRRSHTAAFIPLSYDSKPSSTGLPTEEPLNIFNDSKSREFRVSLEESNAILADRDRDAKLVKRVLANYKVVNVKVGDTWKEEVSFIGDSAAAFDEIQRIVEPVVVFWSNHFDDSGMSMQEKVRSCAQKLLRKSSLSIYKCYNPKKGAFATYFDEAYRRELMKLLKKEIKIIFYDPTQYYQPEEELMVDGEAAIDVRMSLVDGMDIKNKLQKILPAVEWELFSERFMYGNRVEDIAEQPNCSMSKVYRRTDKSMNKVRKLLCLNEYAF